MDRYALVEKDNRLAVHGLFATPGRARHHLRARVPDYVARGYYMDKTLTVESFAILDRTTEEFVS